MKLLAVQFDRVFDIHQRSIRSDVSTEFSFESGGQTTCGAQVAGHHDIPVGEPLVVAMGRQGDWKTLYGWKNLADGTVTVETGGMRWVSQLLIGVAGMALWLPFMRANAALMTTGTRIGLGVVTVGLAFTIYWPIRQKLRLMAAARLLRQAGPGVGD